MARLTQRSMQVGEAEVAAYAELSGDFNPLHLDEEFARGTAHGTRIAHGTLSLNLLWQSIASTYGLDRIAGRTLDVRFLKPVYLGDTVTTGSAETGNDDGDLPVWVKNQHGVEVISGLLRAAS